VDTGEEYVKFELGEVYEPLH